jgi:hypothetical protein
MMAYFITEWGYLVYWAIFWRILLDGIVLFHRHSRMVLAGI